jgi:hypothetical protein
MLQFASTWKKQVLVSATAKGQACFLNTVIDDSKPSPFAHK